MRTYTWTVRDPADRLRRAIHKAEVEAIRRDTSEVIETQWSNENGEVTFTELPDDYNDIYLKATWHKKIVYSDVIFTVPPESAIIFTISSGDAGTAMPTGFAGYQAWLPFDCTIKAVYLEAKPKTGKSSGSIEIDIWKRPFGDGVPTDSDSITALAVPSISSGVQGSDTTLSDWITNIIRGDSLGYNVDSCSDLWFVCITLDVEKS